MASNPPTMAPPFLAPFPVGYVLPSNVKLFSELLAEAQNGSPLQKQLPGGESTTPNVSSSPSPKHPVEIKKRKRFEDTTNAKRDQILQDVRRVAALLTNLRGRESAPSYQKVIQSAAELLLNDSDVLTGEETCSALDITAIHDEVLASLVGAFLSWDRHISDSRRNSFVRGVICERAMQLASPAPRTLLQAAVKLSQSIPGVVVESVFCPLLIDRTPTKAQCELACKLIKTALDPHLHGALLLQLLASTPRMEWGDTTIPVLQAVVNRRSQLGDDVFVALVASAERAAERLYYLLGEIFRLASWCHYQVSCVRQKARQGI